MGIFNVKIICTFNTSIDKVDKALLGEGRMTAYYEFQPLSSQKTNKILNAVTEESTDVDMTLAAIFQLSRQGFLAWRRGRLALKLIGGTSSHWYKCQSRTIRRTGYDFVRYGGSWPDGRKIYPVRFCLV